MQSPAIPVRSKWIALFALITLGVYNACSAAPIVQDGEPNAQIVIPKQPQRSTRLAAWELRKYIHKMSGAVLPIVNAPTDDAPVKIYIGQSEHTDRLGISNDKLKYGAYRIVSGDKSLVLIGQDTNHQPIEPYTRTRGQWDSEKMLSQWDAASGSLWSHPVRFSYKHYIKQVQRDYELAADEEPMNMWAHDERGSFNAVCGFLRELGVRWYMPGELGEVVPKRTTIALPKIDRTNHPAFRYRGGNARLGIHDRRLALWLMRMGMRFSYGTNWEHGLNHVTWRDEMKRIHPEYYALYNGKRDTEYRHAGRQCLSTRGFLKQTVAYARTMFDYYDCKVVNVQPGDGYTGLCQCQYCQGRDDPDRAYRGRMSDYVWDFTVRVANEVAMTHPDGKISNLAYNLFLLPPENIDKLPNNVIVTLIGARQPTRNSAEEQAAARAHREAWSKKTDQKMVSYENYPHTQRGHWLPNFTARNNAASINAIKGTFEGDIINPDSHIFMPFPVFNSYQIYFTCRMYWGDENQDVDPMLDEYYRLFYGPAASQMKAFFDFCEANWQDMRREKEPVDKALALFDAALAQTSEGSVYSQRLAHLDNFLDRLRARGRQIVKQQQRAGTPAERLWQGAHEVKIDGKLDDVFWREMPGGLGSGWLREVQTGRKPTFPTHFKMAWGANSIYFAIRCEGTAEDTVNIGTKRDDDAAIWMGDVVEILLETEQNSYYQIAINPAGAVADLNRQGTEKVWRWDAQAEVATHVGEDYWTAEVRIPVIESSEDPYHQVIGLQPTHGLPWYFNVCRQRVRGDDRELSAYSPTGENSFQVPARFAKFYKK